MYSHVSALQLMSGLQPLQQVIVSMELSVPLCLVHVHHRGTRSLASNKYIYETESMCTLHHSVTAY